MPPGPDLFTVMTPWFSVVTPVWVLVAYRLRVPGPVLVMAAVPVSVIAKQEDLGDFKLYRIPEPVTVAANFGYCSR